MTRDEFLAARKEAWQHPIKRLWSSAYHVPCPYCRVDLLADRYVLCSQHCEKCGQRVIDDDDLPPEELALLPTVSEYREASNWYGNLIGCGILIVIVSTFLSLYIASLYTKGKFGLRAEWVEPVVMIWAFCGPGSIGVILHSIFEKQYISKMPLRCQQCKENSTTFAHHVISSRHCPFCGESHLSDDPDPGSKPVPLMPLNEALQRARRGRKMTLRWSGIMSVLFLMAVAIVNTISIPNAPVLLQSPLRFLLFLFGFLVVTLDVMIRLFGWRNPLRCPHCQSRCKYAGLVIATKHCDHCGQRVIAEPVPPEMACANSV